MALNIKNRDVERLVNEVAELAGESKTETVRVALIERRARLRLHGSAQDGADRFQQYLETSVWPFLTPEARNHRLTRAEEDALLGYGPDGV